MGCTKLFRRRFLPNEIIELKDDVILSQSEDIIITKWDVLKPRKDISSGISAYYMKDGVKTSKVFDSEGNLVYWYCDIIETSYDESADAYTFTDLLIDVLVYPDGHVEVVDLDEFADVLQMGDITAEQQIKALKWTDALLQKIYAGHFNTYTDPILTAEKEI